MTLGERLNRIPPKICRLVANHRGRPLSNQDLSTASGLARSTIVKLSKLDRWDGVTLGMIERFSRACGVDFFAPKRSLFALRKRNANFARRATPQQRKMYQRILNGLGATANVGATPVQS